jgi:hypothetical protein
MRSRALASGGVPLPGTTATTAGGSTDTVVIDWGLSGGVATIVCYCDGSVSLYLSSGGGVIGAGDHEAVRKAARRVFEEIAKVKDKLAPVKSVELPAHNQMRFTLATSNGFLSRLENAETLQSGRATFAALADATQSVLTEIRLATPPQ